MKPFETLRATVLRVYRLASVPVLAALVLWGLDALGVFGQGEWPEPFYTLAVLLTFAVGFAWIPCFFVAVIASVRLVRDWKVALPVWLFVAGSVMGLAPIWTGWEERGYETASLSLLAASALSAVWAGWSQR